MLNGEIYPLGPRKVMVQETNVITIMQIEYILVIVVTVDQTITLDHVNVTVDQTLMTDVNVTVNQTSMTEITMCSCFVLFVYTPFLRSHIFTICSSGKNCICQHRLW